MHDAQQFANAVASVRLVIKQEFDFIEAPGGLAKMLSGNGSATKNMREYENVRNFDPECVGTLNGLHTVVSANG